VAQLRGESAGGLHPWLGPCMLLTPAACSHALHDTAALPILTRRPQALVCQDGLLLHALRRLRGRLLRCVQLLPDATRSTRATRCFAGFRRQAQLSAAPGFLLDQLRGSSFLSFLQRMAASSTGRLWRRSRWAVHLVAVERPCLHACYSTRGRSGLPAGRQAQLD